MRESSYLQDNSLQDVLHEHECVLQVGVGTLQGFKVKTIFVDNATPKFYKAKSIPYDSSN